MCLNSEFSDPLNVDSRSLVDYRPLVPPLNLSTTFMYGAKDLLEDGVQLLYARQANPSHFPVELRLAQLDGGEGSLLFTSGMGAISSVLMGLQRGDELVIPRTVYWPLQVWLRDFSDNHPFKVCWIDEPTISQIQSAITPRTRIIWLETPSNPELRIAPIPHIARIKPDNCLLIVDATCASPALLRPIDHGADVVVHSASKCIGGHNDLLAGVVTFARKDKTWSRVRAARWAQGNALGVLESYLLMRSLGTLEVRMKQASQTALKVARFLESAQGVTRVMYPGLESHPDHALASSMMCNGFGCLIGLFVDGDASFCERLCSGTSVWQNATSFGGIISLIEHRYSAEYRIKQSAPNYVRLSVGLEDASVLINDLMKAFRKCSR